MSLYLQFDICAVRKLLAMDSHRWVHLCSAYTIWYVTHIVEGLFYDSDILSSLSSIFSFFLCFINKNPFISLPLQDFLFPRSLQPRYKSTSLTQTGPSPPVGTGRPLFPPVRHLSFRSPVTTRPDNNLKTVQALPSADRLWKLQLAGPPAGSGNSLHTALKNPQR